MPGTKPTTAELLKKLSSTRNFRVFVERYGKHIETVPFHEHIRRLCEEKGIVPAHVIARSGIDRIYGHQLFNGTRKPPRDRALQLAIALDLDYEDTQELLKTARKRELYPKIKRDAAIIFALKRGLGLNGLQDILLELSLPLLGEERYD